MIHEDAPNHTIETLAETVSHLTTDQIRFVVARQEHPTDKEAARAIGVSPETVKSWKYKGAPIDQAVRLLSADGIVIASELRRRSLAKAMAVKVAGLDSGKEPTRQSVATEIIEWEMGRATQRQEISGKDGTALLIEYVNDWRHNPPTIPAPRPADDQESGKAAQLVECGAALAQDNDGDVDSS